MTVQTAIRKMMETFSCDADQAYEMLEAAEAQLFDGLEDDEFGPTVKEIFECARDFYSHDLA